MKHFVCLFMSGMLALSSGTSVLAASDAASITKQLNKVKQEIQAAKQLEKKASNELASIQNQKEEYREQVAVLQSEINTTSEKLNRIEEQISEVEDNLLLTTKQLEEAEVRVVEREKLFDSRLQLLYMKGVVSYLDVLFSSTSFVDFLDRLMAIQSIVNQDKVMVERLQADKQDVEDKKEDIVAQLDYVEGLYKETNGLLAQLQNKKESKAVAIASLESKEDELELLSEEQERQLFKLVDEQSKLIKKQAELNKKTNNKKITKYTGGELSWPLPSSDRITSYVGGRINPVTNKAQNHSGLDIAAPAGSKIVAAASGTVVLAQWYGNFGNTVIVEHKDGFRTLYAHIRSGGIKVKAGDEVNAGDKIAEVGSTGRSTGNHLHFGVYVNNNFVDPIPYLGKS